MSTLSTALSVIIHVHLKTLFDHLLHLLPEHPDQPPQVQLRHAAPVVQPHGESPVAPLSPPTQVHTPAAGQRRRGQRLELLSLNVPAAARGWRPVNLFTLKKNKI